LPWWTLAPIRASSGSGSGADLTDQPLTNRRAKLVKVLHGPDLLPSRKLPGTADEIVAAVRKLGLEGVIAKRKDSAYETGQRSGAWQKLKLEQQQEFVIGGYRPWTTRFAIRTGTICSKSSSS
jgi:ATP-dependent DNA ligase